VFALWHLLFFFHNFFDKRPSPLTSSQQNTAIDFAEIEYFMIGLAPWLTSLAPTEFTKWRQIFGREEKISAVEICHW
jgi:hypothetical protein